MTVLKRHPVDRPSISQEFANRSDRGIHLGVDYRPDYPGQTDFPVYAAHDGFVVFARGTAHVAGNPWEQIPNNGNNGNSVIIQAVAPHQECATSYNHLGTIAVKEGQWVTAGTFLGYMGWTGFVLPPNAAGTHLHFELFIDYGNGQYPAGTSYGRVDPLKYFAIETTIPIAPGASGGTSTTKTKELFSMDQYEALMAKLHEAVNQTNKALSEATNAKVAANEARDLARKALSEATNAKVAAREGVARISTVSGGSGATADQIVDELAHRLKDQP